MGQKLTELQSLHPGLMRTELQRDNKAMQTMMVSTMLFFGSVTDWLTVSQGIIFKPAKFGAYTELFAGFSPEVTVQKNGSFLFPWGRFSSLREDVARGLKPTDREGTGLSKRFWEYCESEVGSFKGT